MGNSSTSALPKYSCYGDDYLSRNSVTPEFWDTHNISDAFRITSLIQAVIILLFLIIGLPSNAIIILSIIWQKLYKETTHILLLNLVISDLLVCLLVMPTTIIAGFSGGFIFGDSDYVRCQVCQTGLIFTGLTVLSVNILGLISLDRFIFIKFPFKYNKYVTVPRVIIIVIAVWLISILEAVMPLFKFGEVKYAYSMSSCVTTFTGKVVNKYYSVSLVVLNLVPIIVIIVTNIWIACLVKKQIRKVYMTRKTLSNKLDVIKYNNEIRKKVHKTRNKKQLVLIRAFGAILVTNLIVWTPLVISTLLLQIVDEDTIPIGMYTLVYVCLMVHSVVHPLIEGCLISEIKMTFKKICGVTLCEKILHRRRRRRSVAAVSMNCKTDVSSPSSPTGSCLDVCSLAVLPDTQA